MNDFKFELDREGVAELMRSTEMMNVCRDVANNVRARAGDGYEVSTYMGRSRVNASVKAETRAARQDNYDNNTLLKALRG